MQARKGVIVLASLFAIILVALVGLYFAWSHEPSYQGKTLSAWIEPFCQKTPKGFSAPAGPQYFEELQPVRRAVSEIGTNGLPFLIAKLDRRESAFQLTFRQLLDKQPFAALKQPDPRIGRIRAIRAILGPRAEPAIPSLATQLSDPLLSEHAVYALSGMGPNGMRALVNQFANVSPAARMQIATTLMFPASTYRGENVSRLEASQFAADVMIDGLTRVVQDTTSPFRKPAVQHLGTFGAAASNALPALLPLLNDQNRILRQTAIRALGEIKSQPDLVIPALTNLLNDPDPGTQMAARFSLRAFGYNPPYRTGLPGQP